MPNDDPAVEERFAVEVEVALEMGAAEEEREPITVVGPHFVVGNLVDRGPERDCFGSLMGLALEVVGDENGAVEAVAIAELEMQFASLLGAERDDAEFLKSFAQGSGERRFIRIDFPPGPLILPAPKPRFCG